METAKETRAQRTERPKREKNPGTPDALERRLADYLLTREVGENLWQFFARHTDEDRRALLAGEAVPLVMRDPSPGPVSHGVEG